MFDSFFRRLHRTQHFEISLFANCFRNQFQTQIQVWLGPDSDAADVAPATAQYWAIISESRASWIPCRTALYNWVRRRPARARLRRLVNSARPGQSRVTVTAWAGPAIVRWAVREERGQIYCAPEVLQITNRYNENDGVSKRVHELAFGIVICFGHWLREVSGRGTSADEGPAVVTVINHCGRDLQWHEPDHVAPGIAAHGPHQLEISLRLNCH